MGVLVLLFAAYGLAYLFQGTTAPDRVSSQVENMSEEDNISEKEIQEQASTADDEEPGSDTPKEASKTSSGSDEMIAEDPLDKGQDLAEAAIAIYFEPDQYRLQESFIDDLEQFVKVAKEYTSEQIVIEGNQNSEGSTADQDKMYGEDLSKIRAERVAQYLIDNGIDKIRITIVDNGSTKPLNKSNSPEEMRLNRRTDIYFLGYMPEINLDISK